MSADAPNLPIPAYEYGWAHCFSLLQRAGFAPRRILDVGANHGQWTRTAIRFFPAARYVLVEPQGELEADIQDLRRHNHDVRWITGGVSDRPGELLLSITPNNDTSSSFILTAEEAAQFGFPQRRLPVFTINELVRKEFEAAPELVKIDAEGYDLKALAGAGEILGRTEVFFMEAAICATRIENSAFEVIRAMKDAGYMMIDLTDVNRRADSGLLWLCEFVFLKETSPLLARLREARPVAPAVR
jgi:FkbM family methyltransferase